MNATTQTVGLIAAALFSISSSFAQDNIRAQSANETIAANCPKPRDNFYNRYLHTEKRPLPYDYVHEKDVFWEKVLAWRCSLYVFCMGFKVRWCFLLLYAWVVMVSMREERRETERE